MKCGNYKDDYRKNQEPVKVKIDIKEVPCVTSKEDFIDQFNKVRLIAGMKYELREESEDDYTIVDETGELITLDQRYFYD